MTPGDTPTCEQLRDLYARMSLIRQFEERLKWLVETGVPVGAVHYYTGQEAVAAGVCVALNGSDWIASTHRGHGHCIAKGMDVRPMMAELFGKVTGSNRGKGGSMHITDVERGMLGVNPIVGAGVAHAMGAGLSAKVRKTNEVAVAFFGEGAAGIGTVHECMNMAAIWKLPVIFVCENNGYAQATPFEYASSIPHVADRAGAYGMPGNCGRWTGCDRGVARRGRRGDPRASRPRPLADRMPRPTGITAIIRATIRCGTGWLKKKSSRAIGIASVSFERTWRAAGR